MKGENFLSIDHHWPNDKPPASVGLVLCLLTFAVLLFGSEVRVAQAQSGTPGTLWTGAMGITETMTQIMQRQRILDGQPRQNQPPLNLPLSLGNRNKRQNPQAIAAAQWPVSEKTSSAATLTVGPLSPQSVGTNWTGATLGGVNPINEFPPDTMGAAGPTQFIIAANNRIVSFIKSSGAADGVLNVTTDTFFNSVRNGVSTIEPRIRYDRLSGRWFMTIRNLGAANRILIAVSDALSNGTVSGGTVWTFFFFQIDTLPPAIANNCEARYPTLGIDVNALYIGANNFCAGPFDSTDGFVVRKSSVLGAGPIIVTAFRGLVPSISAEGPFAPQGVDNHDPAATEGYFIGSSNAFFSELVIRRVTNPATSPSISGNLILVVPLTYWPINVPHLGNAAGAPGELEVMDDRLFAAHIRNGGLWTAHNIGVNNAGVSSGTLDRDAVRWYEIVNLTTAPTLNQAGTVFDSAPSNPRFYWMPTIMVSGQGHAALGFSTAGAAEFINAGTVGRLAGDALGTTQTPVLYTTSSTAYNPAAAPLDPNRWGEYSYTSLDPIDDMTMWTIQEFCDATDSYGLRIAKLIAPPPATPVCVVCTPTTTYTPVPQGQPSYNVTIGGVSAAGSGYYDPGANPPAGPPFNHITATVSGGVVVNSVTYVNPTQIVLNLNTVAAAAGPQNVTVTNPDGQSATGTGILFITVPTAVTLTGLSAQAGESLLLPLALALGIFSVLLVGSVVFIRRR